MKRLPPVFVDQLFYSAEKRKVNTSLCKSIGSVHLSTFQPGRQEPSEKGRNRHFSAALRLLCVTRRLIKGWDAGKTSLLSVNLPLSAPFEPCFRIIIVSYIWTYVSIHKVLSHFLLTLTQPHDIICLVDADLRVNLKIDTSRSHQPEPS